MDANQAFEILSKSGGLHAARIVTENTDKFSRLSVWRMARALRRGVPVAKIIHQKWFYGLRFYTNKYTLDPRPDTETLVMAVIADVPNKNADISILDLGTGTGCIAAALAKNLGGAHVVAIDRSRRAARVARKNIRNLGLSGRVDVQIANFARPRAISGHFDIIVSNPPYIARGDTRVDTGAMHDPKIALYAGNNGFAAYADIAKNARNWIRPGGRIYLEIGDGAGQGVQKIFTDAGWIFVNQLPDLAGINRVMIFSGPK